MTEKDDRRKADRPWHGAAGIGKAMSSAFSTAFGKPKKEVDDDSTTEPQESPQPREAQDG